MDAARVRPEIVVGPIRPPGRLAPYSHALGAEVSAAEPGDPERTVTSAFGRLILLHDPDGGEGWGGTFRLVAYIQTEVESAQAVDPLLPEVAWSWLTEALEARRTARDALGGTVTATGSMRFGDIGGPERAHQLELRASWTALETDLTAHVEAFADLLASASGLPPVGVTALG